jgi:hypothetical protein
MRIEELEFGKTYEVDVNGTTGVYTKGELKNGFKIKEKNKQLPYGENSEGLVCFGAKDNFDYKEVLTEEN